MLLKQRWTNNTQKTSGTTATQVLLSSRRGTTTARRKKNRYIVFLLQHHQRDPTWIFAAMAFTLVASIVGFLVALEVRTMPTTTLPSRRGLTQRESLLPISPRSLFSKLRKSVASISAIPTARHPRGHRYYDYWQDEEHEDFEPYPWTSMKRPSPNSIRNSNSNRNSNRNSIRNSIRNSNRNSNRNSIRNSNRNRNSNSNSNRNRNSNSKSVHKRNNRLLKQKSGEVLDDESYYVPQPTGNNQDEEAKPVFNDQSLFYAELRESYESFFPSPGRDYNDPNANRVHQAVEDLQTYTDLQTHLPISDATPNPSGSNNATTSTTTNSPHLFYDIHNCPDEPPLGYPVEWNLLHDVLAQWPADDPELPESGTIYQGLCVFDLRDDYETNHAKAMAYRNAEVPFVVRGDLAVAQTVERWNTPHYLEALIGDLPQGTETSASGRFTYWTGSGVDTRKYPMDAASYEAPTGLTEMTFAEWIRLANVTDPRLLSPEAPHYYFRVVGCAPGTDPSSSGRRRGNRRHRVDDSCSKLPGAAKHVPYLTDELPFYTQTKTSLYIKEPLADKIARGGMAGSSSPSSKALNCRFGMKGVMATNHFDGERNFVTVLSGERRYILAHPRQCGNMALYPYGHPSARHSAVDWARPDLGEHPEFERATGNEVVLQAGDSLFLPSLWFHYIVSMSMNVQCNTRSGMDERHVRDLDDSCGW